MATATVHGSALGRRTSGWSSLSKDLKRSILEYVGPKQFLFVAPVAKDWNDVYRQVCRPRRSTDGEPPKKRQRAAESGTSTSFDAVLKSRRTILYAWKHGGQSGFRCEYHIQDEADSKFFGWNWLTIVCDRLAKIGDLRTLQWVMARNIPNEA